MRMRTSRQDGAGTGARRGQETRAHFVLGRGLLALLEVLEHLSGMFIPNNWKRLPRVDGAVADADALAF